MSLAKYTDDDIRREFVRRLLRCASATELRAALDNKAVRREAAAVNARLMRPEDNGERGEFLEWIAHQMGYHPSQLRGTAKTQALADSRQVAMVAMRNALEITLVATGEAFDRDHGTVIHAREKIRSVPKLQQQMLDYVAKWQKQKGGAA